MNEYGSLMIYGRQDLRSKLRCWRILAATLLVSACVSNEPVDSPSPITAIMSPRVFETVAVVTTVEFVVINQPDSTFEDVDQGVKVGATSGTILGAIVGSTACGPFFMLCIPTFAAYGMAGGALAGGAYGLAVSEPGSRTYGFAGISRRDEAYFMEVLSALHQSQDPQIQLSVQLQSRLPANLQTSQALADVQLKTILNNINFTAQPPEKIRTEVVATLIMAWADAAGEAYWSQEFRLMSEPEDADTWLADDGKKLSSTINESLNVLATDMSTFLLKLKSDSADLEQ